MEEEEIGDVTVLDVTEDAELYPAPVEEPYEEASDEPELDEVVSKSEYNKAMEIAENQRIRAEKAEKKLKGDAPKATTAPKSDNLTTSDLYALINAKVPQEDISEVTDYAQMKKIPVSEALKSSVVKAILSDKQEIRTSASATNTGVTRRGNSGVSDETLLANVQNGVFPEDDAGIKRLVELRNKR